MNRPKVCLLAFCLLLSWVVEAAAWEVKIVNNTGHQLRYEVYQQTLWGEKLKCSGYYGYDSIGGGTCPMDFIFCPTRVNIYVARNYWGGAPDYYQALESGYLGAQCWNHRVEVKPVDPNTKTDKPPYNPPMTWVWSWY
jgi:hypothetical protein